MDGLVEVETVVVVVCSVEDSAVDDWLSVLTKSSVVTSLGGSVCIVSESVRGELSEVVSSLEDVSLVEIEVTSVS